MLFFCKMFANSICSMGGKRSVAGEQPSNRYCMGQETGVAWMVNVGGEMQAAKQ